MKKLELEGTLVSLMLTEKRNKEIRLDGFWRHGPKRADTLLIFVHGMYSNFYSSMLKKELFRQCLKAGCDCFSFNNRGAEERVRYEKFEDCLRDLDAVLRWGQSKGYRRFILLGHSTGCQKITFYQARRQDTRVKGIVLLAPGDDYAIARRDAGASFKRRVKTARALVAAGRGDELMPSDCMCFSARRYLSIADPNNNEAKVFDYAGGLYHFRRLKCPVLLLFGAEEQYACLPVETMHDILREAAKTDDFTDIIISGGDHSFHGVERLVVGQLLKWVQVREG